jgi:NurA-like 5'-3' nuclease
MLKVYASLITFSGFWHNKYANYDYYCSGHEENIERFINDTNDMILSKQLDSGKTNFPLGETSLFEISEVQESHIHKKLPLSKFSSDFNPTYYVRLWEISSIPVLTPVNTGVDSA